MSRPRLLDLFAGAGGCSVGYSRAGYEVTGVDIKPQPNYPFEFIDADALFILSSATFLSEFDVIHASPPCQTWTAYRRRGDGVGEKYYNLIRPVQKALRATGKPYVIENVPSSPVNGLTQLCGSSFGLDVRRHRWFESNIPMMSPPCNHDAQTPRFAPATNRTNLRSTVEVGVWRIPLEVQQKAMGIDWMTREELSEAIPPAFTEFIGRQLIDHLTEAVQP